MIVQTTMTQMESHGLMIEAAGGTGILHGLTGVIAEHEGDIGTVSILENTAAACRIYFEVTMAAWESTVTDLRALPIVRRVEMVRSMDEIYGKRIIIMDRKSTRL